MTDREKMVELLEQLDVVSYEKSKTETGFMIIKHGKEYIADHLLSHGVTVKEPKKPLKLEEASGTNEPVWMEYITGRVFVCDLVASPGWNGIYDAYIIGATEPKPLPEMYYGKTWRCWAEKPTDEERKAAEWDQ